VLLILQANYSRLFKGVAKGRVDLGSTDRYFTKHNNRDVRSPGQTYGKFIIDMYLGI